MATATDDGDHYTSDSCVKDRYYEELADSMGAQLLDDSPMSAKCCIFRAPEVLRRSNRKAYEPDIVSIGPFHRKKKSLQTMEKVKKWYLRNLLRRRNISLLSLIKGISEFESRARECYQEVPLSDASTNEFLEMMVMDGCFLIELFRKREDSSLISPDDPIFNMACIRQCIYLDFLLLENQLPFFVLQKLFFLTKEKDRRKHSLNQLVTTFFSGCFSTVNVYECKFEHLHILDLIRYMLVGSYPNQPAGLGVGGKMQIPYPKPIPCVTSLLDAGIRFKKGSSVDNMLNINFTDGVIQIPPFSIDEITEPMFKRHRLGAMSS